MQVDLIKKNEYPPMKAVELIGWLKEKLKQVPEEYRQKVYFETTAEQDDDCCDSYSAVTKLYYNRPETDKELAAIKTAKRKQDLQNIAWMEANLKSLRERLE